MSTISILLVDDHLVVRSGLAALLGTQPDLEVVAEAQTGEQALELAAATEIDVVVMDLAMGAGMDGIAATKALRALKPDVAVLIFTTYDSDSDIVRAVDAGAIGYLFKDANPLEIFAAIRGANNGQSHMSQPVATKLFAQMRNPENALTPREAEILSLLSKGLSNKELSKQLFISEATVKTHLAHVFSKLGVETRAAAIAIAIRREGVR